MKTDCQCTGPGYCERHKCQKTQHHFNLCKNHPGYFKLWEENRGPGQKPGSATTRPAQPRPKPLGAGPGTELKALIAKFKIFPKGGCDCKRHAEQMDQWGPDRCLQKMDAIIGWLEEEAKKRNLPFVRMGAKILVRRAIHNARKKQLVKANP